MGQTEACSAAQRNTVTEYTASYFHGLDEGSISAASKRLGGADVGIAFRPEEVIALGFDLEKRGRMTDCRM